MQIALALASLLPSPIISGRKWGGGEKKKSRKNNVTQESLVNKIEHSSPNFVS
jgi:hypothetical protein